MFVSRVAPFSLLPLLVPESTQAPASDVSTSVGPWPSRFVFAPGDNNAPVRVPYEPQEPKQDPQRIITDADLYGKMYDSDGNLSIRGPSSNDLQQDQIGDCYLLAALGAVADQQPDKIKTAITYDPATQNFHVTLYQLDSGFLWIDRDVVTKTIEVTQADLQDNIRRQGGSKLDNGYTDSAWVAVMETAIAKLHDGNWNDGLDEGYNNLVGTNHGGFSWSDGYINASEVMFVVTGRREERFSGKLFYPYGNYGDNDNYTRLFADAFYTWIDDALKRHAAVTLSTDPESTYSPVGRNGEQDGLRDDHQYVLRKITKDPDGTIQITLLDPHGNNLNVDDQPGSASAEITVDLQTLIKLNSLEQIRIEG